MDIPDRTPKRILSDIYRASNTYTKGHLKEALAEEGGLADLFFKRINSEKNQGDLNSLSEIVDEVTPYVVSGHQKSKKIITYGSHPGFVFLMQNTKYKNNQNHLEIYKRIDLNLGYKLHFVSVERERKKDNPSYSRRDMGLYITNEAGEVVYPPSGARYSITHESEKRKDCISEMERMLSSLKSGVKYNLINIGLSFLEKAGLNIDQTFREHLIKIMDGKDPFKDLHKDQHQ